jgi:hypothetical protein
MPTQSRGHGTQVRGGSFSAQTSISRRAARTDCAGCDAMCGAILADFAVAALCPLVREMRFLAPVWTERASLVGRCTWADNCVCSTGIPSPNGWNRQCVAPTAILRTCTGAGRRTPACDYCGCWSCTCVVTSAPGPSCDCACSVRFWGGVAERVWLAHSLAQWRPFQPRRRSGPRLTDL